MRVRTRVENPEAGRPLLLINGIGASGDLFEPFRAHLGDRTTISFDAPGVGGSATLTFTPSMRRLAEIVSQVCVDLGYCSVDVLGLSWGGLLAQELARRHPEIVRRLVLVATSSGWTAIPGEADAMAMLLSPMRYLSADNLRRVAPMLYGNEIEDNAELLEGQIDIRLSQPPTWTGYMHQLAALVGWSSLPWLHRIDQPTLVLAGDEDSVVPLGNAQVLANRIPHCEIRVVTGGGHLFLITRGRQMADTVRTFLD